MSLHPLLRDAWALCESTRTDLLAAFDAVSAARWSAQPAPGCWGAPQQADHLLKAEVGTSKVVRRLIRGDYAALVRPEQATLHDSGLASYPFPPALAPSFLEPASEGADEAKQQLAAAHARFREELSHFTGDDPDALAAPDPASDFWFTLAGWVRVQAFHEAHHLEQVRELTRST